MTESSLRIRKIPLLRQVRAGARRGSVIEASAGTGKTFTIENLLLDLILEPDPGRALGVENILVVTFTEMATAELRAKIRRRIENLLQARESDAAADEEAWVIDDAARARLRQALFSFDAAPIHTIHAFCQRVLRENAFLNRQLFEQERIDTEIVFRRTLRSMLRSELLADAEVRPLLDAHLATHTVENLETLLLQAARLHGAFRPSLSLREAEDLVRQAAETLRPEALIALAGRVKGISQKRTERNCRRICAGIEAWRRSGDYAELDRQWREVERDFKRPDELEPPEAEFLSRFDRWCAEAPVPASMLAQALLPRIEARMDADKQREGVYDFQDMLSRVRSSLYDSPLAAQLTAALRTQYACAIVDEFQDTDGIQWDIFRRIFLEGEQTRLFVVGDPKQAIYGFRGADVFTYREAVKVMLAGREPERLALNFRSTPAMVCAYNDLLTRPVQVPGRRKNEIVERAFFTGANEYAHPVGAGRTGLTLADGDGAPLESPIRILHDPETETNAVPLGRIQIACGEAIAAEIQGLLGPRPVFLAEGDRRRRVEARDIFVLTETNGQLVTMAAILREAGIPYAYYKQEGLFQTPEATDVRDLLRAIERPDRTDLRLRAWGGPFFEVPWGDLDGCRALADSHPLFQQLLAWRSLAVAEDYGRLFRRILSDSHLTRRELFLKDSERDLTNYQHLFEVLLETAMRRRCSLAELTRLLDNWIQDADKPDGESAGMQRIETEKAAVKLMTMHRSKGLEAAVVFVYALGGGIGAREVNVFHDDDGKRCLYVGSGGPWKDRIDRERDEERQRVLYVAVTRAQGLLYLPLVGSRSAGRLHGTYRQLNTRLLDLRHADALTAPHYEVVPFAEPRRLTAADIDADLLAGWNPAAEPLPEPEPPEVFHAALRERRAWTTSSYSRMKKQEKHPGFDDDEKLEAAAAAPAEGLRGGTDTGLFIHDLLEHVDPASFTLPETEWGAEPSVDRLFGRLMARHGVDARFADEAKRWVFRAMTRPVPLPGVKTQPSIASTAPRLQRELEFLYPIPESAHPPLSAAIPPGGLRVDRGFLKGFIDVVFEHEGKVYVADWKTDRLRSYDMASMDARVRQLYPQQINVYSFALARMLGLRSPADFARRFGGVLYVFVRGLGDRPGPEGFWIPPVSWDWLQEVERSLITFEHYG